MIADLKPYPAYRPSSQAWLGDVPQHWSVVPNRALFAEVKDREHPGEEMLSVTITKGIVRQKALLAGSSKKDGSNLDRSAYKLVLPRDIAYNKMRAWQGAIGASALRGIISPAYVVVRLRKDDDLPSYFHHLYRTPLFAKEAERWSYGIASDMWSLRPEHFKMIYTPEPPPAEQAAIVRFLDWANGRLEGAIRAKRKVIALLNEQKQAIIHRAVTRGLDPSAPLKPSGIPWLGEIPENWEIVRSGSMFRLFGGYAFPGPGFFRDESDVTLPLLLTPVNFDPDGGLRFGKKSTVRFRGDFPAQFKLRTGDLVTVLTDLSSKRLILGRAGFIEQDGVLLNQRTARVDIHASVRQRLSIKYLRWVLNSRAVREQTIATSRGSTVFHTSPTRMLAARWPLPPINAQEAIIANLETLERRHQAICEKLRQEIQCLREYRTRLFADIVTGKLDVREAAPRLPEEAAATTAEDDTDLNTDPEAADEELVV